VCRAAAAAALRDSAAIIHASACKLEQSRGRRRNFPRSELEKELVKWALLDASRKKPDNDRHFFQDG
jgi:hypothetical protein